MCCHAERDNTRYGPLYGCCNGFLTASKRTKTCEQWKSASLTCVGRPDGCLGGIATSDCIASLSRDTYVVSAIEGCACDP